MIPVRIINDAIVEEEEELISRLQLEPVEGNLPNVQIDPDQTTLIIEDDDSEWNCFSGNLNRFYKFVSSAQE